MFKKENKSIVDLAKDFEEKNERNEVDQLKPPSPADSSVPETTHIADQVNSLLENIQGIHNYVDFNLPSLGKAYPNYGKETIGIRPLKFSDEKKIQSLAAGDRALDGLNEILKDCLEGPDYSELTLPDKLFALFKLRQLSYGSEYPLEAECEKCSHKNSIKFQLSSMPVNYLEDSMSDMTQIYLPDSKKTAIVKVIRVRDEEGISQLTDIINSLPRYVVSVEGITDQNVISLFLEGTTVRDVGLVRTAIFSPPYGIVQDSVFKCDACGAENQANVSINANFFSPS